MTLNECIIISLDIGGENVLVKNRDRAYKPIIEVVHTIKDGIEIAYMRDVITDWSEGMNEFGIGIVNTTLQVGYDETEKKIVKKTGRKSKDGAKIRKALLIDNIEDVVKSLLKDEIKGHTFVSDAKGMTYIIEMSSKHNPTVKKHKDNTLLVRTNHGFYTDAGYRSGKNYKSSKIRKVSAEKIFKDKTNDMNDVSKKLDKQFYNKKSNLNMVRYTDKMITSSQLIMNLDKRILKLRLIEENIERFDGVKKSNLSDNPKIKVIVKR